VRNILLSQYNYVYSEKKTCSEAFANVERIPTDMLPKSESVFQYQTSAADTPDAPS
jgi:hypothetical protein